MIMPIYEYNLTTVNWLRQLVTEMQVLLHTFLFLND